jgi:hypothetical protein
MKYIFIVFIYLLPLIANAQIRDLIITKDKDSLFCKITAVDEGSITYYQPFNDDSQQILRSKVKKFVWNTDGKTPYCENGFVIKNNGEKVAGGLFINTNSHGIDLDRPFENVIYNVTLKNEIATPYSVHDLKGFFYCDTMYMRIQNADNSYQFVQFLESGQKVILAKGVNTEKSKWKKVKVKWWEPEHWDKKFLEGNNDDYHLMYAKNFEYMRVTTYRNALSINPLDSPYPVMELKYATETYFLIVKGKAPIQVNQNNFYKELENLFENIDDLLKTDIWWFEENMIKAVKIINEN